MNADIVWLFYAGILAQGIFLLLGQFEAKDFLKLAGCVGISLLGLLPGKHEMHCVAIAGN